ncbi:MAG: hypothetical protein RIE59_21740 [Imperialibacter sp.]
MNRVIFLLLTICAVYGDLHSQPAKSRYKERTFQLSFFPGIGTNGLESGFYFNRFSLNLFGGMSAGSHHFELGGISNINTNSSTGIQMAGLANVIGSQAYFNLTDGEELSIVNEGFSCNLKGIQFSGLLNFVRNNVEGIQLTGGFNFNNGYVHGFQLAGLGNMAGKQVFGVQMAGLYNIAIRGMTGSQASLLFNYTYGELSGLQLGAINRAVQMEGKNSSPPGPDRGIQFGLINVSSEMDGTQVGLINIARKVHGTQIGLINIFKPSPYQGSSVPTYGTQVGPLNFGSSGVHTRLFTDELFAVVLERTTGNCQNCTYTPSQMPFTGRFKVVNQNALIFAYNPFEGFRNQVKWGLGYGFMKVFYNKHSMIGADTINARWFLSAGIRTLYLNRTKNFDPRLSLLHKIHAEFGLRRKKRGPHLFIGLSFNAYFHEGQDLNIAQEVFKTREESLNVQYWPGYSFGLHF